MVLGSIQRSNQIVERRLLINNIACSISISIFVKTTNFPLWPPSRTCKFENMGQAAAQCVTPAWKMLGFLRVSKNGVCSSRLSVNRGSMHFMEK